MALFVFLFAFFVASVSCEIISSRYSVIEPVVHPVYFSIPKYSPQDVHHSAPGNGRSYIDTADLQFRLICDKDHQPESQSKGYGSYDTSKDDCGMGDTSLELLMFRVPDEGKSWIEYWQSAGDFCCTAKMIEDGKCTADNEDKLIEPTEISDILKQTIVVNSKSSGSSFSELDVTHFPIKKTGLYIILLGVCQPFQNAVLVEGTVDSMDPYGYLPADMEGDLPFYETLTCIYTVLGFLWMIICVIYSHELISVQHYITLVIFLGMVETSILYSHYLNWNDHGTPYSSMSLQVTAILFGVLKRAASRVLVLIVSLGYGVVKPSLAGDGPRIMNLTAVYVVLSFIYDMSTMQTHASMTTAASVTDNATAILALVLALVDVVFYILTFSSLENTVEMLEMKKQSVKLLLYSRFSNVLSCSLIFSIGWVVYSTLFIMNDPAESLWPYHWAVDGLWEVAYLVILISMMILWAPSKNSSRFAYSQVSHKDDDDEEEEVPTNDGVELTPVSARSDLSARAISSVGSGLVKKKKAGALSPTHSTTNLNTRRRQDEEELNQEYGNVLEDSFKVAV